MIHVLLGFLISMRFGTEYFDSTALYWWLNSVLSIVICIYTFNKSEKTVFSLVSFFFLLAFFTNELTEYSIIAFNPDFYLTFWPTYQKVFIGLGVFFLIFSKRYDWKKANSDPYDPSKVQAIYSKPKSILTLLGATASLSPKCSVRYSYDGQTIRFKKNEQHPIAQKTTLKGNEIILNTDYDGRYFIDRFEKIKDRKYNLFTFNCRSLLNAKS